MAYYPVSYVTNTMKVYRVGVSEAIQFLESPLENAFLFSSGEVYIPDNWND